MKLPLRPKIAVLGYSLDAAHRLASALAALGAEPVVCWEPGEMPDTVLGVAADYRLAVPHGVSEVARVVGDRHIPAVALVSEFTAADVRKASQSGIRLTKAPGRSGSVEAALCLLVERAASIEVQGRLVAA